MSVKLQALLNVRRDEIGPVALAMGFFFCVLTALMVLRPARESLGMQGGIDAVRWLFMGTALITLLLNPLFGLLVSRLRRMHFISATYVFFIVSLLGFYLTMTLSPQVIGVTTGQVFYVWFSVFNLFATMVFWALMADRFSLDQSKRFFGLIAVGGTCGAIAGPWLASVLASRVGTPALLLISCGFLVLALAAAWALSHLQPERTTQQPIPNPEREPVGGGAWDGLRAVLQSRYLLGIAGYVLILAVMATFIYFTKLGMVAAHGDELDTRTTLFARIDLVTQLATLAMQVLVAGHLMKRVGVPITLALLPLTTLLGFVGLALVGSLAALIVFEASFRAVQRAIMRPTRETLFTVTRREDKYKAKAVIDTFVYRGGDVAGAQVEGLLARLGMGLAAVASIAVPLALVWAALALWLGRTQQRMALAAQAEGADVGPSPASPPESSPLKPRT